MKSPPNRLIKWSHSLMECSMTKKILLIPKSVTSTNNKNCLFFDSVSFLSLILPNLNSRTVWIVLSMTNVIRIVSAYKNIHISYCLFRRCIKYERKLLRSVRSLYCICICKLVSRCNSYFNVYFNKLQK